MTPPRVRLPAGLRLLVPLLLLLLAGGGVLAHAAHSARKAAPPPAAPGDTVTIFGPKVMTASSNGAYHVEQFSVTANANTQYELRVVNGNGAGANRVTGLSLKIDGAQILISDDIAGKNEVVRPVSLAAGTVTLEVTATGAETASVTVSIRQMPDPTFEVLQPKRFTRLSGSPAPESYAFTLPPSAGTPYYLKIRNGNPDGTNRVSSATVLLNGVQVLTQNQLNQNVEGFVQVTMQQSNTLVVEIGSSPGSFLEIAGRATDILPPVIQISSPAPNLITKDLQVTAAGTVTDVTATRVTVNGVLASRNGNAFTATVPLPVEGPNTLTYTAIDGAGLRTDSVRTVIRDTEAPVIVIDAPANGLLTADTVVTVTGKITDRTTVTANLNGIPLTLASDGSFSQAIAVTEGANYLSVTATDVVGNSSTQMREATRDRTAPVVAFTAPGAGHITSQTSVGVTGTVQDASATTVAVNGVSMSVTNGTFSGTVPLPAEGTQALSAVATDAAGNTGNASRTVIRDTQAPQVTVVTPAEGALTRALSVMVTGTIVDSTAVTLTVAGAATPVGAGGSFSAEAALEIEGSNPIALVATDAAGNQSSPVVTVVRDRTAPVVAFTVPAEGAATNQTSITVEGTVQDASPISSLEVNGVAMTVANGTFSGTVPLAQDGAVTLTATATDAAGNSGTGARSVVRDTEPPVVAITSPAAGHITKETEVAVTGTVQDASATTVSVNGVAMTVDDGTFSGTVPLPAEGTQALEATATDAAGNTGSDSRNVVRDTQAPLVTVLTPADGALTKETLVTVTGTVVDSTAVTLTVAGASTPIDAAGAFASDVALSVEGANPIALVATDAAGNQSAPIVGVTRDTEAPVISWTTPEDGSTTPDETVTVAGSITDASAVTATLNGGALVLGSGGAFSVPQNLVEGANAFSITATDAAGNAASASRGVTRALPSNLPPDPATVAPVLDRTVATNVGAATEFLYTGTNPIQTGVAPGTIDVIRAAGLRGRVVNRDLQPVSGVAVTVRDHPEYGQTLTRADGGFDLVVNGGGPVRLDFEKASYLPAQRQTDAPWLDWVVLDDVILLQLDPVATPVTLGSSEAQVVRGSVVEDADGPRQATLVIPAGTTAEIVLPDGTTQPATAVTLRATEYTVGENGPAAMPGILPATSAYTYAAEISVDGLPAGADVVFSTPVPFYVENFLDFPVGTPVPTGTWDPARGVWVPTTDGRVIAIVSTTGGIAEVDVTGDGVADSPTVLAQVGITTQERQALAATYTPGTQLQRTPIFRTIGVDLNYPHGLLGTDPRGGAASQCDPNAGTAALCTAQAAAQRVDLPGTDYGLAYTSVRAAGSEANRTLDIDLIGATIPADLTRVDLEVTVAGRKFTQSFTPAANLRHTFVWDGKDAYGRPVQGTQPVSIRIGHVFPFLYNIPAATARSFGLSCQNPGNDFRQACQIPSDVDSRARSEGTRWQTLSSNLGTHDPGPQAMGGWTLGIHHAYDPASRLLYRGDGSTRGGTPAVKSALRTVAGTGTSGFTGDGGQATQARLWGPEDMRAAPSGDVYVADYGNHRVRRISREGIVTTVAGGGTGLDGGPATQARLQFPHGVWLARDGSLLIAEEGGNRIRRVGTDGVIHTVAGTGIAGNTGDGGPATAAQISTPRYVVEAPDGSIYFSSKTGHVVRRIMTDGTIVTVAGTGTAGFSGDGGAAPRAALNQPDGIALGPDGSLYLADQLNNRVRRVAPSGQITTVAGSGVAGFAGDGGQATAARLNRPQGLEVGADGSLYIADSNNNRIRRVSPDGVMSTVAGNGTAGYSPEGGAAAESRLRTPRGVTRGPDGSLYVADFGNQRVRRIAPAFPGLTGDELAVTSETGAEVYVFDARGRHLRTQTASTGDTLYLFGYDGAGRLATVRDREGRVTTLERGGTGAVTAVTGPDGVRTALDVNAGGNLESLSLPGGATVHYTYGDGGLLTGRTDANNQTTHFDYDAAGRLIGERRPDGSSYTATRSITAAGTRVAFTTGAGATSSFTVRGLGTGGQENTVVLPTGEGVVTTTTPDGRTVSRAPDGTETTVRRFPDPRAGMQAPLTETVTRTPAGLQRSQRLGRALTLDPLNNAVVRQADSLFLNGRLTLEVYERATRQLTRTTPGGIQTVLEMDGDGRVAEVRAPGFTPVTRTYDAAGRMTDVVQGGRVQHITYDAAGRVETHTDAAGRTVRYEYDAAGRLSRHVLADGRAIGYGYDGEGNLTTLTPPSRPAHRLGWSAVGLNDRYVAPDVGQGPDTTRMVYGADRRIEQIVRPGGSVLQMGYDAGGRRSTVTLAGGTITYGYDAVSGALRTVAGLDGVSVAYAYDGPLNTGITWTGPVAGSVGMRYDNDFRVVAQALDGADSVRFTYDANGLLSGAGALAFQRSTVNGLPLGTTLGSVATGLAYNGFGERTSLSARFGTDTLFRAGYTRDGAGRITGVAERVGSESASYVFQYDSVGRLRTVTRDGQAFRAYEYDANGNRVREVTPSADRTGTADARDQLTTWGGAAYTYTRAGEVSERVAGADTTRYRYDALGNLRGVTLPGGGAVVDYLVDGENRRVGVKVNGVLERGFLWEGELRVAAELNAAGAVVSRFVYGERRNVPEYMVRGGKTYRLVHDHLGSVRLVVDAATGEVAQRIDYDPYGRVLLDSNPGFQPFGFAGGLSDHRTGVVRFGARDYDPETGRWLVRDPVGFDGGDVNLYAYAMGDPVNGVDPDGTFTLVEIMASDAAWEILGDVVERFPPGNIAYNIVDPLRSFAKSDEVEFANASVALVDQALAQWGENPTEVDLYGEHGVVAMMDNYRQAVAQAYEAGLKAAMRSYRVSTEEIFKLKRRPLCDTALGFAETGWYGKRKGPVDNTYGKLIKACS